MICNPDSEIVIHFSSRNCLTVVWSHWLRKNKWTYIYPNLWMINKNIPKAQKLTILAKLKCQGLSWLIADPLDCSRFTTVWRIIVMYINLNQILISLIVSSKLILNYFLRVRSFHKIYWVKHLTFVYEALMYDNWRSSVTAAKKFLKKSAENVV